MHQKESSCMPNGAEKDLQECARAGLQNGSNRESLQVRLKVRRYFFKVFICRKTIKECKVNEFYEHLSYTTKYHNECEKVPKTVCHTEYHQVSHI